MSAKMSSNMNKSTFSQGEESTSEIGFIPPLGNGGILDEAMPESAGPVKEKGYLDTNTIREIIHSFLLKRALIAVSDVTTRYVDEVLRRLKHLVTAPPRKKKTDEEDKTMATSKSDGGTVAEVDEIGVLFLSNMDDVERLLQLQDINMLKCLARFESNKYFRTLMEMADSVPQSRKRKGGRPQGEPPAKKSQNELLQEKKVKEKVREEKAAKMDLKLVDYKAKLVRILSSADRESEWLKLQQGWGTKTVRVLEIEENKETLHSSVPMRKWKLKQGGKYTARMVPIGQLAEYVRDQVHALHNAYFGVNKHMMNAFKGAGFEEVLNRNTASSWSKAQKKLSCSIGGQVALARSAGSLSRDMKKRATKQVGPLGLFDSIKNNYEEIERISKQGGSNADKLVYSTVIRKNIESQMKTMRWMLVKPIQVAFVELLATETQKRVKASFEKTLCLGVNMKNRVYRLTGVAAAYESDETYWTNYNILCEKEVVQLEHPDLYYMIGPRLMTEQKAMVDIIWGRDVKPRSEYKINKFVSEGENANMGTPTVGAQIAMLPAYVKKNEGTGKGSSIVPLMEVERPIPMLMLASNEDEMATGLTYPQLQKILMGILNNPNGHVLNKGKTLRAYNPQTREFDSQAVIDQKALKDGASIGIQRGADVEEVQVLRANAKREEQKSSYME